MSEADITRLIALEPNLRNRALLTLAYGGGLRASEICALRWRDLSPREGAGQVTVFGEGGKTRVVLLSAKTWKVLTSIRSDARSDAPVFRSRKGDTLSRVQPHRIVKEAAGRDLAGCLRSLAPACPRFTQPQSRRTYPSRAGDSRARQCGHYRSIYPRTAV